MGPGIRYIGREFHQRDRHRDLCRLSVGAVPESAAHRDPIRATDGAGGRRANLFVVRGGVCSEGNRMAAVLCCLCRGGVAWPARARMAAAARTFRCARDREGLAPHCLARSSPVKDRHCERKRSNPWAASRLWIASSLAPLATAMTTECVQCLLTTLHLLTTASVICPASCEHAISPTFTATSLPTRF